jgi:hypothetical protein
MINKCFCVANRVHPGFMSVLNECTTCIRIFYKDKVIKTGMCSGKYINLLLKFYIIN